MNYTETQVNELQEAFRVKVAAIYGEARNYEEFWPANDRVNELQAGVCGVLGVERGNDSAIYKLLGDIAVELFDAARKRLDEAEITTAHMNALEFIKNF